MNAQEAYISMFRTMTDEINGMLAEVPAEDLYRRPGPSQNPVGWNYWHLLRIWDNELHSIIGGKELREQTWFRGGYAEKSGYDPAGKGGRGSGTGMGYTDAEVDEVQIPLSVIQEYQRQLQDETEAYLRGADEAELNRVVPFWAGEITCGKMIEQAIRNGWMHYGEMRYAKGILGYPDASYLAARSG